jgi:hypothetical protein
MPGRAHFAVSCELCRDARREEDRQAADSASLILDEDTFIPSNEDREDVILPRWPCTQYVRFGPPDTLVNMNGR